VQLTKRYFAASNELPPSESLPNYQRRRSPRVFRLVVLAALLGFGVWYYRRNHKQAFAPDARGTESNPETADATATPPEESAKPLLSPSRGDLRTHVCLLNTDVFLKRSHHRTTGGEYVKRAGLDFALGLLARRYTILFVHNDDISKLLTHVLLLCDPHKYATAIVSLGSGKRLAPLATKDCPLNLLGRPLDGVVVIDSELRVPDKFKDNVIVMDPWTEDNEADLLDTVSFLMTAAIEEQSLPELIKAHREAGVGVHEYYRAMRHATLSENTVDYEEVLDTITDEEIIEHFKEVSRDQFNIIMHVKPSNNDNVGDTDAVALSDNNAPHTMLADTSVVTTTPIDAVTDTARVSNDKPVDSVKPSEKNAS